MKKATILSLGALIFLCGCSGDIISSNSSSSASSGQNEVEDVFTNEILSSLQGRLALEGTSTYKTSTSNLSYLEKVTFIENAYSNIETQTSTNTANELTVFKNDQGEAVSYYLKKDNTLGESKILNDIDGDSIGDEPANWSNFTNPFNALSTSDFQKGTTKGEFVLSNEKAKGVASVITLYDEPISSFKISVSEGKVTNLTFSFTEEDESTGQYDYEVKSHGASVSDIVKPTIMTETDNHRKLADAISKLSTEDFTLNHKLEEGEETTEYKVYYGTDAYFYDYSSGIIVPGGAVVLDDGIYEFTYADETLVKGDKSSASSIKAYNPHCSVSAALFEDKGNGLFKAYDIELPEDKGNVANVAAAALDNLSDRGNYATSLEIQLTEDLSHVATIKYDYLMFGSVKGTMTLTYSNYGETDVPIDFSSLKEGEVDTPTLPGPTGTFTATQNSLNITTVTITNTTISFDGVKMTFEIVEGYANNSLRFTYNGTTFTGDYYGSDSGWFFMSTDYTVYFYAK